MWSYYNVNKILDFDILMIMIMLILYINFVYNLNV